MDVIHALKHHTPTKVRVEKLRRAIAKELVQVRPTNKGRGLFASADFAPGEVITIVDGACSYGTDRDSLAGAGDDYSIFFNLGSRLQRITPRVEEVGWHCANHSCSPNAKISDCLMAVRAIHTGDEITTCYGWFTERAAATRCLCGEPKCFGKLGPKAADGELDRDDLIAFVENQIANKNAVGLESTTGVLGREVVPPECLDEVDALIASIPKRYDYRVSEHRLHELGFYVE